MTVFERAFTKAGYEVLRFGTGYGHKWWDVDLDHAPSDAEIKTIADALDGGTLFGYRSDGRQSKGGYRIVGYTD